MQTNMENIPITPNPSPLIPEVIPEQPMQTTPQTPRKPDKHILVIFASIAVIFILLLVIIGLARQVTTNSGQITINPTPSIDPIPTSNPNRPLSAIATQSAFLQLDQAVASLSSAINQANTTDASLTPPVVEFSSEL